MENISSLIAEGMQKMMKHLSRVRFEDIPQDTVHRARLVVADTFGCMLSGKREKAAAAAYAQVMDWGGASQATMWGFGARVPLHHAAYVNALCARANDYGPVETFAGGHFKPLHISETMVPATLAAAEKMHAGGREILKALICAEDFVGRLSGCMDLPLPLDCRGTLNTMGAAVAYGKLMSFEPQQFQDALWLALHQMNGIKQGTHFQLSQGFSAMHGLLAADLVSRGLKGVDDPDTELKRLYDIFVRRFVPEDLMERLGEVFYTTTTFKPWPACRATHAGIECAVKIAKQTTIRPERIREVVLTVSPWTMKHAVARPFQIRNYAHADAIYSLQYVVAVALLYGRVDLAHLVRPAVEDERIRQLIGRIRLSSEGWPAHADDTFLATGLKVSGEDGKFSAYVSLPRGNSVLGEGLSTEEIRAKFLANAAYSGTWSPEEAERAWDFFSELETRQNMDLLAELAAHGKSRSSCRCGKVQ